MSNLGVGCLQHSRAAAAGESAEPSSSCGAPRPGTPHRPHRAEGAVSASKYVLCEQFIQQVVASVKFSVGSGFALLDSEF